MDSEICVVDSEVKADSVVETGSFEVDIIVSVSEVVSETSVVGSID